MFFGDFPKILYLRGFFEIFVKFACNFPMFLSAHESVQKCTQKNDFLRVFFQCFFSCALFLAKNANFDNFVQLFEVDSFYQTVWSVKQVF